MHLDIRLHTLLGLALLAGCGSSVTVSDTGPPPMDTNFFEEESWLIPDAGQDAWSESLDAPPPELDAPALDDAPSSPDAAIGDAGPMPCTFTDSISRTCSSDADCTFDVHQTDCCGNTTAMGINRADAERFAALEPICRASYPGCGCPAFPTQTDSGETVTDTTTVQVGCISRGPAGVCMTYVAMRPMDGV